MTWKIGFLWGLFGGIIVEALSWYKIRRSKTLPNWFGSMFYWGSTVIMIIIGGVLVVMYLTSKEISLNAILAVNIGASAPLIIATLADKAPPISPGSIDTDD